MDAQIAEKRTVIGGHKPVEIRIYPVQSFETRKERIIFDNHRMGFICNGQFTWQPCPPDRNAYAPWLRLTRTRN